MRACFCWLLLLSGPSLVWAQTPPGLVLPAGTAYAQGFRTPPGGSASQYPAGWFAYAASGGIDTVMASGDAFSSSQENYRFGDAIGLIGGDDALNPGFLVLKLADTRERTGFRISFTAAAPNVTFTGGASLRLEVSTTGPASGFTPVSNTTFETDNFTTPGTSQDFQNIALPPSLNNQAGPVYLRWRYQPNTGFGSRGDGLALDSVRLSWSLLPLNINLGPDDSLCPGEARSLTGGPARFSYVWSTGDSGRSISVSQAGTVYVQATAPSGATGADTIVIGSLPAPAGLGVAAGPSNSGQLGAGTSADPDRICAANRLEYSLSPPAGFANTGFGTSWQLHASLGGGYAGTQSLLPPGAQDARLRLRPDKADGGGSFTLRLIAEDLGSGCRDTLQRQIDVLTAPVPSLPDTARFCAPGDSVLLDAFVPGASYSWSTGSTAPAIHASGPGSVAVTLSAAGCQVNDTVHLALEDWAPELGPDRSLCAPATLSAQYPPSRGAATYLWSTGATTPGIQVADSANLWVLVQTPQGCVRTDSVQLAVRPRPASNLPDSLQRCGGRPVLLSTGNPAAAHQWSTGATGSSIALNRAGGVWVELTQNGCTRRDTAYIRQDTLPPLDLGPDRRVCGPTWLNAGPGASYSWSLGDSTRRTLIRISGTYAVAVRAANGCTARDTVTLQVDPPLNLALLLPDTLRAGEPVVIRGETDAVNPFWEWHFGNQDFSFLPDSVEFTYTQSGTFTVRVRVDDGECTATDSQTVVVLPAVTARAAEAAGGNRWRVFPNPVRKDLQVLPPRGVHIQAARLRNLQGRLVARWDGPRQRLPMPELPEGAYVLEVAGQGGAVHRQSILKLK